MSSYPPPYYSVTGIYSSVTKHHSVTREQYDGVARPGQLVVDTNDYTQLYIGDDLGILHLVGGTGNGYRTLLVTSSTYVADRTDYYIGVNRNSPVSITLPTNAIDGDSLVIKDESGNCSINNITIIGKVDNSVEGAILAIDNGALHMIYRNGWRII